MLFHSSINAFLSCARVAGGFRRFLTLLSSSSHMCSIGVKSGLYGSHASGAMLLFARKSWQTRATCGRALSCCRIRLRCCTSGTATGRKISSLYLTAVILPATITNCDFIPWAMPPQTITEPPPNRSRSTTQASTKRSPRRRYTRRRPSARWRVNLDSSVKRTRLHCLIGNSLGACAVNHAIRRNLRAWVRGRPTYGRRARRPISRNRLPTVFGEICRLCVPTVLRAVSVAVRWRFRKCARRIVLSWRRDVTRGRPDRGRSAKCPVSLKRLTRRSIVETLTPKWLATCCCLWPCISNAIALPLRTSVNRTMIEKCSK